MPGAVERRHLAHAAEQQRKRLLRHGNGVHAGAVRHLYTVTLGGFLVNVVHADAELDDDLQVGRSGNRFLVPYLAAADNGVDLAADGLELFGGIRAAELVFDQAAARVKQLFPALRTVVVVAGCTDKYGFLFHGDGVLLYLDLSMCSKA